MEAVAIQVNQAEAEKPKVENKKTEPKKVDVNFFGLLKNVISDLERNESFVKKDTKAKLEKTKTDKPTVENLKTCKKETAKTNAGKTKNDELKIDLKLKVDEEVEPKKLLKKKAQAEEIVQLPNILPNTFLAKNDANLDFEKTDLKSETLLQHLLQTNLEGDFDENKIEELLEKYLETEKTGEKKTAKFNPVYALVNKNPKNSNSTENKNTHEDSNSKKNSVLKKIQVKDLRTNKKVSEMETQNFDTGTHNTNGERVATETSETTQLDLTLNLNAGDKAVAEKVFTNPEIAGAKQPETTNFSQMLTDRIYQAHDDIVKAGKIVLKDNNAGTIRLNLQPESLGRVRIFLELNEGKKLRGKVTVNSKEAFSAFQENLNELVASFEENGFQMDGFDISWTSSDGENRQFNNEQKLFGSLDAYENDFMLTSSEDSAEKIFGFNENTNVNVLA